eukprot:PITA_31798
MPFGLKNAGATFQREMDITFAKEIHDFLVVYLDDLTPFSKSDQEHLKHLRQIFMTCRKYDISLNPKKSLFALEEGKLLGHIISKDGIRIDPERIQAILQIPYPRNIKELQAFLGKINFLRRFIPNLAELIRLLRNMLKKDAKPRFERRTLKISDYGEASLRPGQSHQNFRIYILYSHVIAYVPNAIVKDILTQEGLEGKRGKWISSILEYTIEIKPTKLIKGQGLAKLMSETNFQALDINQLDDEPELAAPQISETFMQSPWYTDICFVLLNLCAPPGLSRTRKRFLSMKSSNFCVIDGTLFWKNHEGILLKCLTIDETNSIMKEFHAGDCGGHLYWKSTADKILRAGYYWPSLFANVKKFAVSCHKCQIFEGKRKLLPLPLKPISTEKPFQQWGLDFIG